MPLQHMGLAQLFGEAWKRDASRSMPTSRARSSGACTGGRGRGAGARGGPQHRADAGEFFTRYDLLDLPDHAVRGLAATTGSGPRHRRRAGRAARPCRLHAFRQPCDGGRDLDPLRPGRDGLPVGMQIIAARGQDRQLLEAAKAIEAVLAVALRWHLPHFLKDAMRILVLNPNTSQGITERLMAAARPAAAAGTELSALTAPRGFPYIATRAEAQVGGAVALEMLAEHHQDFDAAIIAAFGDPGLFGARELFDIPVVGMAEAAMLTACMLGRRFAIVTFAQALGPWYQECVESHGLTGRLAGIRMLGRPFESVSDVQEEKEDLLVELARRAVEEDEADVIILAGAPLAGLAEQVKARIPVPVVDQMAAAVKQAEALASLKVRKATAGTFRRPAGKATLGLAAALARRFSP